MRFQIAAIAALAWVSVTMDWVERIASITASKVSWNSLSLPRISASRQVATSSNESGPKFFTKSSRSVEAIIMSSALSRPALRNAFWVRTVM
jgi:hypothetical protein